MRKVLIVDDYFYNRLALKGLIEQFQIECDLASDGQEAMDMVMAQFERGGEASMYGLILIDLNMPVCNGA